MERIMRYRSTTAESMKIRKIISFLYVDYG